MYLSRSFPEVSLFYAASLSGFTTYGMFTPEVRLRGRADFIFKVVFLSFL